MKKIGILGSTGSVGSQALDIIKEHSNKFELVFITAYSNSKTIISQANQFKPKYICISDNSKYDIVKEGTKNKNILSGFKGLIELCKNKNVDIILNAISGYKGVFLSMQVLASGIDLALSNKESIVQAGHILTKISEEKGAKIFPVDSEHSALWQCLLGEKNNKIHRIILTGSGGPFRTLNKNKFSSVTKKQALNHPNWKMGNKITIDSATMMNKGFEVIEAFWLFNIKYKNIDIIIHPESIIHSMIEFIDGSIKAQLSEPTMKIPILFALSYPKRYELNEVGFDFIKNNKLRFEKVDYNKFRCIKLAYQAGEYGGSYTTVLNVANDLSVELFLNNKISFDKIPIIIDICLQRHNNTHSPSIEEIKNTMDWTKNLINKEIINNV